MNLRVDLILDTEQRSASFFNLKMLIRLVCILIPTIILVAFLLQFGEFLSKKTDVKNLKDENEIRLPKVTRADALSAEVAKNMAIDKELAGLKNSTIDWHKQLVELMKIVPAGVEFDSLRVAQSFKTEGNVPMRAYSLTITGKSKGANSKDNVKMLQRSLTVSEFFSDYMNTPDVPVFKQDMSPGAKKTDRVFRMECNYKPRKME